MNQLREYESIVIDRLLAAVFPEDVFDLHVHVPAEATPDNFVYIVIASFAVSDETHRILLEVPENFCISAGPWIDRLTSECAFIGSVPVLIGILAATAMGNIGKLTELKASANI